MIEIREMLRLWLEGRGLREVARLSGTDRKTVRRYVERAQSCGVDREGGAGQLTDELLTAVIAGVRRKRPNGKSQAWETIAAQSGQITAWLDQGLTLTKIHILLGRRGVVVSYRTLNRYARTELGFGKRRVTVRVADCEPGSEVQVDFGRLGLLTDAEGRGRVVKGLIFTAVYSRHMFVYPTHRETLGEVIAGFEAAWTFFGGVFAVVIPDNMKAIVDRANATEPRLNDSFREYAESRGFVVDPARIRSPQDKPRVERCVPYARSNFFAGEQFRDLDDCRERAARWCREVAGMRVHGTTRLHPAEVFATDEHPKLKPLPDTEFDIPAWAHPKVAPDRHVQLNRALYSVPGDLVGQRLTARVDTRTVKLYWRGELIKVHPVVEPGRRHTDPADLPAELTAYATRDLEALQRKASVHGPHIGAYAAAVLEHPLPWTKMRQVYRLLGLIRRHNAEAVDEACRRALEAEAVNVGLIDRMLTRGLTEAPPATTPQPGTASRFVRDTGDFAVRRSS
ncbi:IS21 family transposase [Saccharopolyspora spinosa]|uniref:Transposase n=1 Tax=Saccharopolyspora spinosa TaxID=60894 RepID=A0A2N3XUE8_SACSN|nr:IS21 family transposase [Saccharopolyspora spinosa]PKW14269.1 transposase [Saccharopolyspora spinosa]PKW15519.1 transposase [Saccharopolyspora spinosa]PKW16601.1 transposase [Saccharopolyspora spinosa]PKW16624.1 transposase [Saccharopolyspora spinosa]PKW16870.1 transposase [Saccharopolyspora spinosa]